ncbi:MAG TPA: hypothetical protein GX002_02385 [Clostridiales bacterium]|jgi:hypothetical protein|nr:hypothetical protein [Clostridiales bacterium]
MNEKMKKSIVMIIIYCLCFGFLTLFIGSLYPIKNNTGLKETAADKKITSASDNDTSQTDKAEADNSAKYPSGSADSYDETAASIPTKEPISTPIPTPTPLPVYELEESGYPEIEKFFHDYYVAWNLCDRELLESVTTAPENLPPLFEMEKETLFLDDIRDLSYYIMKSYEDNAYIVYVYYEMKYVNIKTPLPRLDKFYLITDNDGNLKIYNSEMDDILKTYYEERDNDEAVVDIINHTNYKARQAMESDEELRVYVEALYGN